MAYHYTPPSFALREFPSVPGITGPMGAIPTMPPAPNPLSTIGPRVLPSLPPYVPGGGASAFTPSSPMTIPALTPPTPGLAPSLPSFSPDRSTGLSQALGNAGSAALISLGEGNKTKRAQNLKAFGTAGAIFNATIAEQDAARAEAEAAALAASQEGLEAAQARQSMVDLLRANNAPESLVSYIEGGGNLEDGQDWIRNNLTAEPQDQYRPLTPEERAQFPNLDPERAYQVNLRTGEVSAVGGGPVIGSIRVGGEELTGFERALADELGAGFVASRTEALDSQDQLFILAEMEALLDSEAGIITGFGADALVSAGLLLQRVGINLNPDAVSNTQAYAAATGRLVGRIISDFGAGTGLSDADRQYAEAIAAGDISMSEEALRRLIDINRRAALYQIVRYNREAAAVEQAGVDGNRVVPYSLMVPLPEGVYPLAANQPPPVGYVAPNAAGELFMFMGGNASDRANWVPY